MRAVPLPPIPLPFLKAHVCSVNSVTDVQDMKRELMQNGKIARATHNMLAYRLQLPQGAVAQDCDDDGEHGAGSRMLHLMQVLRQGSFHSSPKSLLSLIKRCTYLAPRPVGRFSML